MKKFSTFFLLIIFIVSLTSCFSSRKLANKEDSDIRNVILMIGDGMGLPDVYAAMTVSDKPLNIERCNITGLQKTFSSEQLYY